MYTEQGWKVALKTATIENGLFSYCSIKCNNLHTGGVWKVALDHATNKRGSFFTLLN